MQTLWHFVGGSALSGKSGRFGDVFNPATGELSARVPLASADETRGAIGVAQTALAGWAATPPLRRARVMFKFKELIEKYTDDLARLVTAEHGKTFADAKGSVTRGLEVVDAIAMTKTSVGDRPITKQEIKSAVVIPAPAKQ